MIAMKHKIYMAVTADEYELPIFITDTLKEMSFLTKVSEKCISTCISRNLSGKKKGYKYLKVIF